MTCCGSGCRDVLRIGVRDVMRIGGACGPPPPVAAPLVPRCALLPGATPREDAFGVFGAGPRRGTGQWRFRAGARAGTDQRRFGTGRDWGSQWRSGGVTTRTAQVRASRRGAVRASAATDRIPAASQAPSRGGSRTAARDDMQACPPRPYWSTRQHRVTRPVSDELSHVAARPERH